MTAGYNAILLVQSAEGRWMFPPERIICLTEETVETLYLLGEDSRIVGIPGYVVRPPRARREKPRVSAFTSADIPKILDLKPDLVLTFSDLQADIAAALIRAHVDVHAFNQRTIVQILDMIRVLGALVGAADRAERLVGELAATVGIVRKRAAQRGVRPGVFGGGGRADDFGHRVGIRTDRTAGGIDVFSDRASCKCAKERIVTAEEVIRSEPDIIMGSWCGKKFRAEKLAKRPGFGRIPAVKYGALHEIKSPLILQPGPAALTESGRVARDHSGPPLNVRFGS